MPLAASSRLGPYEVISPIGAGGMGEVYRARDPRMGRDVAIKVSAECFSDRFAREVRAVAALNHRYVCQIYDVGPNYLVMELVDGLTLADRINEGPLPLAEALPIAHQIAEALEAAHEKGIVHRDLKPANIKIASDGTVKVLDFGLAKITEAFPSGSAADSPTIPIGATIAGQVMGTAAYMSPEQARGKPVDRRADIWAFGVVLYEMLTGRRMFGGDTITDTLAEVLTCQLDLHRVPQQVRPLMQRCLERDPKRRLRDIGDAWLLLDDTTGAAPAVTPSSRWKLIAAVLAVALGVSLWALSRTVGPRATAPQSSLKLDLDLGPSAALGSSSGPSAILSPDGRQVVFVSQDANGVNRLFRRAVDQPRAAPLAETEGAYAPFFSPEGQSVGFFAQGKLKTIRLDGSQAKTLCDAPAGRGASWTTENVIVAALNVQQGLFTVPSEGGTPTLLTELRPGEISHRWPYALPGSRTVLFTSNSEYANYDGAAVMAIDLKDRRTKTVIDHAGMYPRYIPSGHLVYVTKGTLFARAFDPAKLELTGPAVPVEEVANSSTIGSAQFDFSQTGLIAYRTGRTAALRTIQWLDADGRTTAVWNEPDAYLSPRLSPGGDQLAVSVTQEKTSNIWVYDWQRGIRRKLTNGVAASSPVWSPDGRFLVFGSGSGMWWMRPDGAGSPQPLTEATQLQLPAAFSPDGTRLAYAENAPGGGAEIRTVPIDGRSGQLKAGKPEPFVKTQTANVFASFSPDGRWLAYADAPAGIYEVFVRAFPDNNSLAQVSNAGGVWPLWSKNGRELFYRTEDQRIMVASYTVKGDRFVPEKPRVWFGKPLSNQGLAGNLDLDPDHNRFIVLLPVEGPEPRESQGHVTLMVNFFDEVRRRLAQQAK